MKTRESETDGELDNTELGRQVDAERDRVGRRKKVGETASEEWETGKRNRKKEKDPHRAERQRRRAGSRGRRVPSTELISCLSSLHSPLQLHHP